MYFAIWFAFSFISLYVIFLSSNTTAILFGFFWTCSSKKSITVLSFEYSNFVALNSLSILFFSFAEMISISFIFLSNSSFSALSYPCRHWNAGRKFYNCCRAPKNSQWDKNSWLSPSLICWYRGNLHDPTLSVRI